ncbi:UDP-2,3-diacylglucosamine diphosphatase [Porifericola rhodea]|uniref:UDP-2,3-diacylglucosamine diphosphatase n=1 Tax=Porifericola rhodea TaxID=930972 RepID=UPI002666CD81|nr:UDP-2,3-diacylglucosamine diphosphatase [Porifericola rhodea]WKN32048.1 UDP-2,3-diacylglucosamine diphosphatase [Porifericola rhodea]
MQAKPAFQFTLNTDKKIYFASDFHLGAPNYQESRAREKIILDWFDQTLTDADAYILLGDLFDFWFEYKYTVPKGFIRFLGKLAEIRDKGIPIVIFTGNHDMWMFDYLSQELDSPIVRKPVSIQINEQLLHIGHGDGLGGGDHVFKVLKKIFHARISQKLFAAVHPRWGMGIAHLWSQQSRKKNLKKDESFKSKEEEWIYQYCLEVEAKAHHQYYVFGHRHLPLDIPLHENSRYYNIGEWLSFQTYGVHDGKQFILKTFEK